MLLFKGFELSKSKSFGTLEIVSCLSRCPYFRESALMGSTVFVRINNSHVHCVTCGVWSVEKEH